MEHILLLLATILCGSSSLLSLFCNSKRVKKLVVVLWSLSVLMIVISILLMFSYLISSRFEFQYVYHHSSLNTALVYKISSLWSGQEGSFLLWALFLGLMGFFVLQLKGSGAQKSFGIYTAVSFSVFFMCFLSQPFAKSEVMYTDGLGLTSALKDPWMVVHPPLVFVSYSAMAILFSLFPTVKNTNPHAYRKLACDTAQIRSVKCSLFHTSTSDASSLVIHWLRISWFFLGFGILSGSIWAYRALGWGGYWAWDPIENAALVPWLILCNFLHRKKYNFKTVCVIPFTVACFGVFLARSGILKDQSAHAYTEGNRIITGIITTFIIIVIVSLAITSLRRRNILKNQVFQSSYLSSIASRLAICMGNTLKMKPSLHKLFIAFLHNSVNIYAVFIFLGTISPILFKYNTPISYYTVISILFVLIYNTNLLLLDTEWLKRKSILTMIVNTLLIIGILVLFQTTKFWWLLLLWFNLMPISLWLVSGFRTQSLKYYLCHIGSTMLIIGAIASSTLGRTSYIIANPDVNNNIRIEDLKLPITKLVNSDMLIKSLPTQDYLIERSQILTLQQGDLMIPYHTKPFIMFFWIGGFMIIASPLLLILIDCFTKHKQ